MSKGIGGTVGTGVKEGYVVRFYAGVQCINNRMVEADTMDHAISMVLLDTVERYDDGLTHVDACLSSNVYNGTAHDTAPRTQYDVHYVDTFTVIINGHTYSTLGEA